MGPHTEGRYDRYRIGIPRELSKIRTQPWLSEGSLTCDPQLHYAAHNAMDKHIPHTGDRKPLAFLINSSLRTNVFPSELKLARVVPIFKASDSSALTN